MTATRHPQEQPPTAGPASPGDVPAQRPASLDRLDALTGEWEMAATFEAGRLGPAIPASTSPASTSPASTSRGGRTTFGWLAGGFFLIQRFSTEQPGAPSGIAVIGLGTEPDTFVQHYYDSRGVARVYQMTLDGRTWKLCREAPGFWQRYTGVISGDGGTITGAWEASADGREWRHDFGLTYIKVPSP
jgi:hypothetical protein